jgi:hypothetical protein
MSPLEEYAKAAMAALVSRGHLSSVETADALVRTAFEIASRMVREAEKRNPLQMQHGTGFCEKVKHSTLGNYYHMPDNDGPYHFDGTHYCGRCHEAIT